MMIVIVVVVVVVMVMVVEWDDGSVSNPHHVSSTGRDSFLQE
jgi:hypothetical protein